MRCFEAWTVPDLAVLGTLCLAQLARQAVVFVIFDILVDLLVHLALYALLQYCALSYLAITCLNLTLGRRSWTSTRLLWRFSNDTLFEFSTVGKVRLLCRVIHKRFNSKLNN